MTIRQLMKERSSLSNIEIHDEHIHDSERIARRYGIEYAIKKERNREAPHYLIFFRSRDTDVLQTAFNEFQQRGGERSQDRVHVGSSWLRPTAPRRVP